MNDKDFKIAIRNEIVKFFENNEIDFIDNSQEITMDEKIIETEKVLDNYKKIKLNLQNIEKNYFTDEEIELATVKEIKFLMSSDFSNNDSYFQEKYKEYLKTKRYFSFLTDSMDKYLETIENDGTLKSEMKIAFIKKYVMEGIKAKDFIKNYANGHSSYFYRTKYEVVKEIIPILWGNDESKLYKIFLEKI